MYLIVGLGNPGERYAHTRHNVGFDVLSLLSEKIHIPISRTRCNALVGEGQFAGEKVALCLPQTYMNLSGEAVQQLMHWYKLPPENLLVIYDDIDLAPGWLRIRRDGSAGTHNGMRSIVACIGTEAFPRIRVGIGGRPPAFELADWVLSRYQTAQEREVAFTAYQSAADAAVEWMRNGIQSAMNRYNTQKPKPPKPVRVKPPQTAEPSPSTDAVAPEAHESSPDVESGMPATVPGTRSVTTEAGSLPSREVEHHE